jgi:chromosomal replication initiation ATPase DnaA
MIFLYMSNTKRKVPNQYTPFVQYLDSHKENNHLKRHEIMNIIQKVNEDFYFNRYYSAKYVGDTYVTGPFLGDTNNYTHKKTSEDDYYSIYGCNPYSRRECIKNKTKVDIEVNVQTVADLLKIIDTYTYRETEEYNIDLKSLINIRAELTELNNMIGMNNLKNSILNQLLYFIQELHIEKSKNVSEFKHTVICGPPGTGKTEVAKIIGRMYSKLGILKNTIFKKVTRQDLVAGYLGQTALKTKDVIHSCLGGVLFIDEAYALANGRNDLDSFSKECIDTICEALSDHKENLMVIIAGYEDELNHTFFAANRGLESRFIWRFKMDEYNAEELYNIFMKKVNETEWSIDKNTEITVKWFEKNKKQFPNFGRDMELLFTYTKIAHSKRIYGKSLDQKKKITLEDVNAGFDIFMKNVKEKDKEIYGLYV